MGIKMYKIQTEKESILLKYIIWGVISPEYGIDYNVYMSLFIIASPCFVVWIGMLMLGVILKDNQNKQKSFFDKDLILSFMMCSAIQHHYYNLPVLSDTFLLFYFYIHKIL